MVEDNAKAPPKRRSQKRQAAAKPADGPAGREGQAGAARVITIFGGSGFVGRRLAGRFVDTGAWVRIAARHPDSVALPAAKGSGGAEAVCAGIANDDDVRAAVTGSDVVINLVGILHESGGQSFAAVHVDGARRVAQAAQAAGVRRLVHMSALGASVDSPSKYARSKAEGERAVREVFPGASVLRPSIVFGPEDSFFNRFAAMARFSPALPLIGGGTTRFQPIYVDDLTAAILRICESDAAKGQTYELGGAGGYSFKELMELMLRVKKTTRILVPVPFFLAEVQGTVLQMLPTPPLTRDQVELLKTDNVVDGAHPGLSNLGITPTPVEEVLATYL